MDPAEIQRLRWYHTIELPGGILTPGKYDLRPIVARLPWPRSLAGMRCLDIGSRDGFDAFYMARLGPAEVVSLDGELIVNEAVIAGHDSLRRRPLAELIVSDGPFWRCPTRPACGGWSPRRASASSPPPART